MYTVREIYAYLQELAPLDLQLAFDNSGIQVGRLDTEVNRVLLALDVTNDVITEAENLGAELLVSHHPLIWEKLSSVTDQNAAKLLRLIEGRIAVISMHTNLDIAQGGVNDVLIRLLGAEPFDSLDADGCGRIGELPSPMPMAAFLARCRERLQTAGLRYVDAGKPVFRLAVMGGSGGSEMHFALEKNCDTYVTADLKYNQLLDAREAGLNLIDGDHFCTETPVIPVIAEKLRVRFPGLQVTVSRCLGQTASFYCG